jgi:hypothetical protein
MRIRIVQRPPVSDVDGICLDRFDVGAEWEVGNTTAALLLAEGWAEPVPLDAPPSAQLFVNEEPVDPTAVLRRRRDLVRQVHPRQAVQARAADAAKPRRSAVPIRRG